MHPKVVIIGRPNVGKSSLLNLLAGRLVSIVDPTAGVTRDRIATTVELPAMLRGEQPVYIELIDTGGYGIEDSQNLTDEVEQQIAFGLAEAALVLFVIDAHEGVNPLDVEVAQMLRKALRDDKKPVMLVANKVDGPRHEAGALEAVKLGFGEPINVAAKTGQNKYELMQAIRAHLNVEAYGEEIYQSPQTGMLLAIVGKRNAGKSTLVNAMAGGPRVIVSEIEGTTRDSVDVRFTMDGQTFTAIDTAGVRKGKSLKGDVEYYSYHRALRSIRRAHVVMLLIDATVPVSQVDKQLGTELLRHYKPTIVVVNKWDLAEKKSTQEKYVEYLNKHLKGLDFAPLAFISAQKQEGIEDLVATALSLFEQAGTRVTTSQLNQVMQHILTLKQPTSGVGHAPKIYYATQLAVHPPTIGLFVNRPDMFDQPYQRYLLNRYRELLPFAEVPIKLLIRGKQRKEEATE